MKNTFHGTRCQNYSVFIFMASGRNFTPLNYIALPFFFITIRIVWLFCMIYSLKRDDYELLILIIPLEWNRIPGPRSGYVCTRNPSQVFQAQQLCKLRSSAEYV